MLFKYSQNQNTFIFYIFYIEAQLTNIMNDDIEGVLSLEPMRLLELFPVRKVNCLDFDLEKYRKLNDMLNCSFCRQIFNNPTYLRCSHRFCKECIQKHIRKNDKKSCPVCRGELTTKRDTKCDYMLNTLITYAYGDSVALQEQINKCQEQTVKKLKFVKTKSGIIEAQYKRERNQSSDIKSKACEPVPKKRSRKENISNQEYTEEKLEQKKIIVEQDSKKREQIFTIIPPPPPPPPPPAKIAKQIKQAGYAVIQKQPSIIPIKVKEPKKSSIKEQPKWGNTKLKNTSKNHQVIEIHSQNSNQIQRQKKKSTQKNTQKMLSQISQLPDISKNSQEKIGQKSTQFVETTQTNTENKKDLQIPQVELYKIQKKPSQKSIVSRIFLKKKTEQQFFTLHHYENELVNARKKVKQSMGQNYMKALIKKSGKLCVIALFLKPKPKSSLTPVFPLPFIKVTINMSITNIKNFILTKLNLSNHLNSQNIIELYAQNSQNIITKIDKKYLTILSVIQEYWKNYRGLLAYDKNNIINAIKINQKDQNSRKNLNTLFYSINFSQIY